MLDGAEWIVHRVDEWCDRAEDSYTGNENTLTLKMLPRALAATGWVRRPSGPEPGRRVATPAFVDDGVIWFSPKLLAHWWEREPPLNKKLNPRVESDQALTQQARELGLGGLKGVDRKDFKLITNEGTMRYWKLDGPLAYRVLKRSRSED